MALVLFDSGTHKYPSNPTEAIADLETALQIDPSFTRAYMVVGHYEYLQVRRRKRGFLALSLWQLTRVQKERFESALSHFDCAVKLHADFTAHVWRGATLKQLSRFDLAIQDFDRAIELESSAAYLNSII